MAEGLTEFSLPDLKQNCASSVGEIASFGMTASILDRVMVDVQSVRKFCWMHVAHRQQMCDYFAND